MKRHTFRDSICIINGTILDFARRYVEKNHPNPYLTEFLLGFERCFTVTIIGLLLILPMNFIYQSGSSLENFLICLFFAVVFPLGLYSPVAILVNPMLLGMLCDKFSGKQLRTKNISIEQILMCRTSMAFGWEETVIDLLYPEEMMAFPILIYYREISANSLQGTTSRKTPIRFFDREGYIHVPKHCKTLSTVITLEKSNLIDQLIVLEPSSEFSVSYFRFSHLLKEIQPIPDRDYAEGVKIKEICNKINAMYP